ncbi:LemA family protein [bacterium]|nr:LemA family protein [bacterium]NCQ55520.1 LemA family protein [Candidatus Parcubacteria bacterium]NCS67531.1 LemA family protein [Candidatus Peregrinibacteria bacterium]NCS96304.1 LemA family protein [bacterium]
MTPLLVIGGAVVALIAFLAGYYNRFIQLTNKVQSAWSDIDTHLKKRYDLIPNLVNIIKGYASHEQETFENVVKLRNQAQQASGTKDQANAETMLTGALKSMFALSEAYPDLKANTNFLDLQETLKKVEDDINLARRYYNGAVQAYNTAIQMFPANILANIFGFKDADFFEAEVGERENVSTEF